MRLWYLWRTRIFYGVSGTLVSAMEVTRAVWRKAMKLHVSSVSTDVLLFSESGSSLVHHYRVFGCNAAHAFLRGKFMAELRSFIEHAEAEVRWEFNRLPSLQNLLPATSDTL